MGQNPPEKAVHALWRKADSLSEEIVTKDGRRLRIVYPGRPNAKAGPDFLDAVIRLEDGRTVTGDVEVHLEEKDWYRHGHHTDPNYNGVVLHVVLRAKGAPSSTHSSGTTAPVVMVPTAASVPDHLPANGGDERIRADLDAAGDRRFLSRSKGFFLQLTGEPAGEVTGDTPDQVLYGALLETLGYSSNRRPFRELARRVPIGSLYGYRREPESVRLLALKAILLGTSGLLGQFQPEEERALLMRLRGRLSTVRPMTPSSWDRFRVRPANQPVRRVAAAAHLADRFLDSGLVSGLAAEVVTGKPAAVIKSLTVPGAVGRGRALELAVNAVLPFFHAWAGLRGDKAFQAGCMEIYGAMPAPPDNEITREMRQLLGIGPGRADVPNARRHQGLIHLYKRSVGRVSEASAPADYFAQSVAA